MGLDQQLPQPGIPAPSTHRAEKEQSLQSACSPDSLMGDHKQGYVHFGNGRELAPDPGMPRDTRKVGAWGLLCGSSEGMFAVCAAKDRAEPWALLMSSQQGRCLRGSWLTPREGSLLGKIPA